MSSRQATIYALVDPTDGMVRYVGLTTMANPLHRYASHRNWWNHSNPKAQWIRQLAKEQKIDPWFVILEQVVPEIGEETERKWIHHFLDQGHPVLNVYDGGQKRFKNLSRTGNSSDFVG